MLVFCLGLFCQWRKKKKTRLLELISFKTIIVEWTKLTEHTISLQYSLCQEFRDKLAIQEDISPISLNIESFLIDKLDNLEIQKLLDMIVINHDGDKKDNALIMLNIVAQINKLSKTEISIKDKYNEFYNYTNILMEQWNSNFNILDRYLKKIPLKIANSKTETETKFYNSLSEIYNRFKTSSISNRTKTDLILPLESICNKFIKNDNAYAEPYSILPIVSELLLTEHRWNIYKTGIIEYFEGTKKITFASYKLLKENVEILDKINLKKWNKIN